MKLAPGAGWDGRSSASASARDLQSHRRVRGVREGNKRWDCILSTSVGDVYLCKCNWYYMVLKCNPTLDYILITFQITFWINECSTSSSTYSSTNVRWQVWNWGSTWTFWRSTASYIVHIGQLYSRPFSDTFAKKKMFTLLALEHISNRRCCCCNVEKAQANTPERDKSTGRGRCHSDIGQGNQSEASE